MVLRPATDVRGCVGVDAIGLHGLSATSSAGSAGRVRQVHVVAGCAAWWFVRHPATHIRATYRNFLVRGLDGSFQDCGLPRTQEVGLTVFGENALGDL
jgi:hypothetical protein